MSSSCARHPLQTLSVEEADGATAALRAAVPDLGADNYKGQMGKVGVMGGCQEYTGAPYFAAMSAMRMGCDLAYVFCTPSAAQAIKGYSPELIVLPCLSEHDADGPEHARVQDYFSTCQEQFASRLTAYIMGPGLGTHPQRAADIEAGLRLARRAGVPVIIDGSALNFIAQRPELVAGQRNVLLTPNIAEFGRLAQGVGLALPGSIGTQWQEHARELAAALDGPVLLSKGGVDVITDGQAVIVEDRGGSPRRCGGQGDILTGIIAAFVSWINAARKREQQGRNETQQQQQRGDGGVAAAAAQQQQLPALMLAAYGGCRTMRAAAALGYEEQGRSLVAGDMIKFLGDPALSGAGLLQLRAAM